MTVIFPTLVGEIAKRGIKKSVIAERLNISERSLYNKLSGISSFTWEEVCTITNNFFPDMDSTRLFTRADDTQVIDKSCGLDQKGKL